MVQDKAFLRNSLKGKALTYLTYKLVSPFLVVECFDSMLFEIYARTHVCYTCTWQKWRLRNVRPSEREGKRGKEKKVTKNTEMKKDTELVRLAMKKKLFLTIKILTYDDFWHKTHSSDHTIAAQSPKLRGVLHSRKDPVKFGWHFRFEMFSLFHFLFYLYTRIKKHLKKINRFLASISHYFRNNRRLHCRVLRSSFSVSHYSSNTSFIGSANIL